MGTGPGTQRVDSATPKPFDLLVGQAQLSPWRLGAILRQSWLPVQLPCPSFSLLLAPFPHCIAMSHLC